MDRISLETHDNVIVGGSVVVPVVAAAAAYIKAVPPSAAHSIASTISALHPVLFLVGTVYLALAWDRFDAAVSRGLQVIAAGFIGYVGLYYPHKVMWHGLDFGGRNAAWLGFDAGAWQTFFHFGAVIALLVVAYGVILLWQTGDSS
jgi:hypothetical protein